MYYDPQHVSFIYTTPSTKQLRSEESFKLKPVGKLHKLQELAWRFLTWCEALEKVPAVTKRETTFERYDIDTKEFIIRLIEQKRSLFNQYNLEGKTLLIGAEDYLELMGSTEVKSLLTFEVNKRTVVGLTVKIIPWMKGMVVMP